jgi:hypothetical protein
MESKRYTLRRFACADTRDNNVRVFCSKCGTTIATYPPAAFCLELAHEIKEELDLHLHDIHGIASEYPSP